MYRTGKYSTVEYSVSTDIYAEEARLVRNWRGAKDEQGFERIRVRGAIVKGVITRLMKINPIQHSSISAHGVILTTIFLSN
jgi:hypothetical protein